MKRRYQLDDSFFKYQYIEPILLSLINPMTGNVVLKANERGYFDSKQSLLKGKKIVAISVPVQANWTYNNVDLLSYAQLLNFVLCLVNSKGDRIVFDYPISDLVPQQVKGRGQIRLFDADLSFKDSYVLNTNPALVIGKANPGILFHFYTKD